MADVANVCVQSIPGDTSMGNQEPLPHDLRSDPVFTVAKGKAIPEKRHTEPAGDYHALTMANCLHVWRSLSSSTF